jgi:hypothetical protein
VNAPAHAFVEEDIGRSSPWPRALSSKEPKLRERSKNRAPAAND